MQVVERAPPVSEGDIVAGKYRVEHVLGMGGMGVVVAATHVAIEQRVALKFIQPGALTGPESVERFLREAKASAKIRGEHVARVYDVGTLPSGVPFIVMELLEGADLAKIAKRFAPVPVEDAVEYVLQACEALIEAHAVGIIHRDLKPQNIFVSRRINGTPLVKVLDFGIFKATGPAAIGQMSLTDSSAVLGSPLYMAPEQMRAARNADVRSDIWSLGIVLYELLGGKVPFDGETVTELCLKVTHDEPPPLAELRAGLPPHLVAAVMRCLKKAPAERFSTVAQLATALEPFSASARRGVIDRPWRSLVDTVDQQVEPLRSASEDGRAVSDKARTGITWGKTGGQSTASSPKPRSFGTGILVGTLVSLAVGGGMFALIALRAPPLPQPAASSPALQEPRSSAAPLAAPVASAELSATATAVVPAAARPPPTMREAPRPRSFRPPPPAGPALGPGSTSVAPPVPPTNTAAASPPASPPAATPAPATPAPNGAPILR